jgi:hypothetical protein
MYAKVTFAEQQANQRAAYMLLRTPYRRPAACQPRHLSVMPKRFYRNWLAPSSDTNQQMLITMQVQSSVAGVLHH